MLPYVTPDTLEQVAKQITESAEPAHYLKTINADTSEPSYIKFTITDKQGNQTDIKEYDMSHYATLDSSGKVPASQLPSYVDDVIEGYYFNNKFYKDQSHTEEIAGEQGKIYVDLSKNESYRWSGTQFTKIGVSDAYSKAEVDAKLATKQNTLVAGQNITIEDNVISASSGTTYTAGYGINISTDNQISVTSNKFLERNQATTPDRLVAYLDNTGLQKEIAVKWDSDLGRLSTSEFNATTIGGGEGKLTAVKLSDGTNISTVADVLDGAAKGKTAIQEHQDISGKQDKIQHIELSGTSGTLTDEQITLLGDALTYIMIGSVRYDLKRSVAGKSGIIGTYATLIDNIANIININFSAKTWDLTSIELQKKLDAGENITISDNVISAAGATHNFPDTWPIKGTCEDFLKAVGADNNAVVGRTYQGGIEFSDLHDDLGLWNAEAEVEIISSTLSTGYKIIRLNVYSATNEPYSWARIYWWQGSSTSSDYLKPWQITARAADQYTTPIATGNLNRESGQLYNIAWKQGYSFGAGVYLISLYGTKTVDDVDTKVGYTYHFCYSGDCSYQVYSTDSHGTNMYSSVSSSLSTVVLNIKNVDGSIINGWKQSGGDPSVEIYKIR